MQAPEGLYQDIILKHYRNPVNQYEMEYADFQAIGTNPLCGDEVKIFISVAECRIEKASFTSQACAVATASASLLVQAIEGKSFEEVNGMISSLTALFSRNDSVDLEFNVPVELKALRGVIDFPARIKCAHLPWRALRAALDQEGQVSTEL